MHILDNTTTKWGDDLKSTLKKGMKLKIAASCFSIYAYEALKKELEKIDSLEFIFTEPTFIPDKVTDKIKKESREFYIPKLQRESDLYGSEFEIALKNKLTQKAIAKECADWIRRKTTFKSNSSKNTMQQFACVDSGDNQICYFPIQGFSAVDLGYQKGSAVSNSVYKNSEQGITKHWLDTFEQIWNNKNQVEDVTDNIVSHIESVYEENSPERIYFLMLYNIFTEFLEDINEDVLPNDLTGYKDSVIWHKMFNFQRDACTGLINKLEKYNGCILADSVGLGKTFTALGVIKYYELRNKSVLVLCPKKLAGNWQTYNSEYTTNILAEDRLHYRVLCHTDLQRVKGESLGVELDKINWGNFDLVVIDESHNFRNNDVYKDKETRYQALMEKVIRSGVKTKVLMLSATPVNNKFNDLRNQLNLAYGGNSKLLSDKLKTSKSIEEIFKNAQATFNSWSELPAEKRTASAILNRLDFDFFELLDSVTIARSRKHIEKFYDTKDIGKFPKRNKPKAYNCPLTSLSGVMSFNEIYQNLSQIKMSVYAPVGYILDSRLQKYEDMYDTEVRGGKSTFKQSDREKSLQRLMTINLLKRLESSVESFRLTLKTLKENHENTLKKIEEFQNNNSKTDSIIDLSDSFKYQEVAEELEDFNANNENTIGNKIKIDLADMDLPRWTHDLTSDLLFIEELYLEMQKVTPKHDEKLQHLIREVSDKVNIPINAGNKKVIIFTAFADTANYLYKHLAPWLLKEKSLYSTIVTGKDKPKTNLFKGAEFQEILTFFSPISKSKDLVYPDREGEIDLLIATDCISEGQNLQDCDYLINYDIHWNPVRIVQRFGRIDRIGSPNKYIQLVNYWPDISLDEYINLKERVENRMVLVDAVATADDNPLSPKSEKEQDDISYRKEQLRKMKDEVIDLEDLKTGVNITDLGLNDFRMDLVNYIKEHGELDGVPTGMHAVIPSNHEQGLMPGVLFTLRNRRSEIKGNTHNRLHPYYLVYIGMDGEIIYDYKEVKKILDLIRNNCRGQSNPIKSICKQFNSETNDGKNMALFSDLLNQAITKTIGQKEESDIDTLFSGTNTTALIDNIKAMEDFELICFLVVKDKV